MARIGKNEDYNRGDEDWDRDVNQGPDGDNKCGDRGDDKGNADREDENDWQDGK